jgi:WD40 repeat protein
MTVRMWDMATGSSIGSPLTGHTESVTAVAAAQLHGRPVIISGGYDTIRVWDLASGAPVGRLRADQADGVTAVSVTLLVGRPVIVSGGSDGTIRIWGS